MTQDHLIHALLQQLIQAGGSDLHLGEGEVPKYRKNGDLQALADGKALTHEQMIILMQEICSPQNWRKFLDQGDLDFAYALDENSRFRCNYHRHVAGLGAIFRLIPSQLKTIKELGLPQTLNSFADLGSGLVLVTGPTGCGKSTTLAALVHHINTRHAKHIVTIEEPIEFVHRHQNSIVTQREVSNDTASFTAGLRSALREDCDVILIGEMRDPETIALALTAAETGMLVLGTLHTNSAGKSIDRIIHAFPANQQEQIRTMLATSLRGVVSQRLLKRADGQGRLAACEILTATPAVAAIIREGTTHKLSDVISSGRAEGMQSLDDNIAHFLQQNLISPDEAHTQALDRQRFAAQVGIAP